MGRTIVTTSHQPDCLSRREAFDAANTLGVPLVNRGKMSLAQLREKYGAENILVVSRGETKLHTPLGEYFFHPSMSVPRIKAIKQGKIDHMVAAMDLTEGDTVLDCTLGLGADAIVAAFIVGPQGRVVGIEIAPELAYMVKAGLKEYREGPRVLQEIMPRIEVICGDSAEYLRQQPDNSFDVVYFDPMFRVPRTRSSSMAPLRGIVNPNPLEPDVVKEALRVARKRVVLKENNFSREFARLGFKEIYGGKYSPVKYGVIVKSEAGK